MDEGWILYFGAVILFYLLGRIVDELAKISRQLDTVNHQLENIETTMGLVGEDLRLRDSSEEKPPYV